MKIRIFKFSYFHTFLIFRPGVRPPSVHRPSVRPSVRSSSVRQPARLERGLLASQPASRQGSSTRAAVRPPSVRRPFFVRPQARASASPRVRPSVRAFVQILNFHENLKIRILKFSYTIISGFRPGVRPRSVHGPSTVRPRSFHGPSVRPSVLRPSASPRVRQPARPPVRPSVEILRPTQPASQPASSQTFTSSNIVRDKLTARAWGRAP